MTNIFETFKSYTKLRTFLELNDPSNYDKDKKNYEFLCTCQDYSKTIELSDNQTSFNCPDCNKEIKVKLEKLYRDCGNLHLEGTARS